MPYSNQRSIVAPPFWTKASKNERRRVQKMANKHERLGVWPYEFFFAGNVRDVGRYANPFLNLSCSQGVCQRVFATWQNDKRFRLAMHESSDIEGSGSARFCLAPSGDGFGWQLMKIVMLGGCVPIIIQPRLRQPFDTLLPYHNFSLSLDVGDIT